MFVEVDDVGQDTVGTRWVITKKEPQDGQKTKMKGQLVAKGFQEKLPPQLDSPTDQRESVKLFCATAANMKVNMLRKIDITAAFLQSDTLKEIFL